MRGIIITFALIVVVSCDVSEIVKGDGWSKDETGYHYEIPKNKLVQPIVQAPPVFSPEKTAPGCPNGGSGPYCCINGSDQENCNLGDSQDEVIEIIEYIDVPVDNLRDYLPPHEYAKRKRQIPVRRQVRKVVRRFARKH